MEQTTLVKAYQTIIEGGFAAALRENGLSLEMSARVAKGACEGHALKALTIAGIDPDKIVFVDADGHVFDLENNPVHFGTKSPVAEPVVQPGRVVLDGGSRLNGGFTLG